MPDTFSTRPGTEGGDLAAMFEDADDAIQQDNDDGQQQQVNGKEKAQDDGQQLDDGQQQHDGDDGGQQIVDDDDLNLDLTGEQQQQVDGVVSDDHKVVLMVDGKEVETTLGALKTNAQKYEAANKRFEEAAAIRKDAETKLAILPERERQLGQVLEYYIQQSQQFMQAAQPDWAKLLEEDPTEYLKQRHTWEQKQTELKQAQGIQTELQRRDAEARTAAYQKFAAEQKELLVAAIPEWKDPQKAAQGARELDNYLESQGVLPEMRAQIDTAVVVQIARKAMLYDRALAKQAAAKAALQGKQRQQSARIERPGAATPPANATVRDQQRLAKADKAFKQNPGIDTLSSFFE